ILIFIAVIQATLTERQRAYQLIKIIGADKKFVYQSIIVEFVLLGSASLIAAFGISAAIVWLLMQGFLNM
ncbi:MAG TPA: FtsX-like permease family protein, partial [Gammaproteobacteria bacterium]|nr:FtsX-like permease family protein [Gammaproteobacteria bacterium]